MSTIKGCVYIYYVPSDGLSWATYLQTKLSEKEYDIPSTLVDIGDVRCDNITHDVNIVLVSPDFLLLPSLKILDTLHHHQSLAVLLGAEESEYRQEVSNKNGLGLLAWPVFSTEATESSVRNLLVRIINLYEEVHKDDVDFYTDEDPYDFLPEARPIIPTRPSYLRDDNINQMATEDSAVVSQNKLYAVLPQKSGNEKDVFLVLDRKPVGEIKVISELDNAEIETCPIKKELYRISLEDEEFQFKVVESGHVLGKGAIDFKTDAFKLTHLGDATENSARCELTVLDQLRHLLLRETDPVCMLCRALRLKEETTEALDEYLAQRCKKLCSLRSLQRILNNDDENTSGSSSKEEWPTLLHFCAEYNLINFCRELLNLPNSLDSCYFMNCEKEVPFDIASHRDHAELAEMLKDYMEQKWGNNSPGNKDSGIEPDPPLPHGSQYMSMGNRDEYQFIGEVQDPGSITKETISPEPDRDSSYMEMGNVRETSSFVENVEKVKFFGDDFPDTPPEPHVSNKSYANIHKDTADVDEDYVAPVSKVQSSKESETYTQMGLNARKQMHAAEFRKPHMQKSYSESDATDIDHLAKLGYNISNRNTVDSPVYQEWDEKGNYTHPIQLMQSRRPSEGNTPRFLPESQAYTCSTLHDHDVQLPQQPPQKKGIFKKLFHRPRKNSLADQDKTIHEEKPNKRIRSSSQQIKFFSILKDKKRTKSKDQEETEVLRISDISTTSNESSSSTDTHPLSVSADGKHTNVQTPPEEFTGEVTRRKSKSQKHLKRRKSKRIVHAEKDNRLHIIDLPSRSTNQQSEF